MREPGDDGHGGFGKLPRTRSACGVKRTRRIISEIVRRSTIGVVYRRVPYRVSIGTIAAHRDTVGVSFVFFLPNKIHFDRYRPRFRKIDCHTIVAHRHARLCARTNLRGRHVENTSRHLVFCHADSRGNVDFYHDQRASNSRPHRSLSVFYRSK